MDIKFLGATQTVTGSKYLLTIGDKQILVDCGLYQGLKELRLRNWKNLPIDPAEIDAVLITHAHIDHTGYIPKFVKKGYKGPIYATPPTIDLCSILLPDSGHIQEEDAKRANKYGYTKHHPALPLYTKMDAEFSLAQFKEVQFGEPTEIFPGILVTWHRAGHILGASCVEVFADDTRILFTGDLGRFNDPVMPPPNTIQKVDYLVTESTYGDRLHDKEDPLVKLKNVIDKTASRGGTILIPAFAVGRAQLLLYYLYKLKEQNDIPDLPISLDSPMAINATSLMCKYVKEHLLSKDECKRVCNVATYINTPEESKELDISQFPQIIISASGMATGGRVLHHLKVFAKDYRNTILFTGFQAEGTRGARMLKGEKEIKIHGEMIPVKADVEELSNTSAHADYGELLRWYKGFTSPPRKVFITHGEIKSSENLKKLIEAELGWQCEIPHYLESESL